MLFPGTVADSNTEHPGAAIAAPELLADEVKKLAVVFIFSVLLPPALRCKGVFYQFCFITRGKKQVKLAKQWNQKGVFTYSPA